MASDVRLEPWGADDAWLLERTVGDAEMMRHLGGPETPEKIAERQERFRKPDSGMFTIVDAATGETVGSIGFWERNWRGEDVYETGWFVLPEFQGRGIATAATAQVAELARSEGKHRFLHAFPGVENAASNAICRKAGFKLLGEHEFEYPKGSLMRCNDWRLDLRAG
jgi:RimJ/RimL family protein N-acetyltransferase